MARIRTIYAAGLPISLVRHWGSRQENEKLRELSDSGLFDAAYYLETYGNEVRSSGLEPLEHYLRIGGSKGYNPSIDFDASAYVANYPDVRTAKLNPLLHYVRHGRSEGRIVQKVQPAAPSPVAPSTEQWAQLTAEVVHAASPTVDVVVPVYRGLDETANCLYRVIESKKHCKTEFDLVVIDDHTPEPQLGNLLDDLERRKLITLIRNPRNLGFVASVNAGMKLHSDRDVILLNSDTEVFGDWVDRLRDALYSSADIGTVTPLSNNATICSYPDFPANYKGPFEVSFEALDRLACEANSGKTVDLPTAIGFCMYIRRECLRDAGYFDESAFGLGYGEENDFSLRIAARGWRNVLAGDVFVRHIGQVSFLDSTDTRVKQGLKIIHSRYPHYLPSVMDFVKNDPGRELRRNLDIARARKSNRAVLFVVSHLEGGTKRHVSDMARRLREEGINPLILQPSSRGEPYAVIRPDGVSAPMNLLEIDMRHEMEEAAAILRALGVQHIHVHHTLGFFSEITHWMRRIGDMCGVSYDVTLHDYFMVCPRINMINHTGRYCHNTALQVCEACVKSNGSAVGDVSMWHWQDTHEAFLKAARRIFVPDESARQHFLGFFPDLRIEVREHPEDMAQMQAEPVRRMPQEPLRVAVLGAIGPHKGSVILEECAHDARKRNLPLEFHLIGYSDRDSLAEMPNVNVSGRYKEKDLMRLLGGRRCHIAFLPSPWPETYSYTLSEVWAAGLYPVVFDLGAMAHRIRRRNWGHLIPIELASSYAAINDILLSLDPPAPPAGFRTSDKQYATIWSEYYGFDPAPARQNVVAYTAVG